MPDSNILTLKVTTTSVNADQSVGDALKRPRGLKSRLIQVIADTGNSSTVYVGGKGQGTEYPLYASGPPAYLVDEDVTQVTVNGRGTSGQYVYFICSGLLPDKPRSGEGPIQKGFEA